MHWLITEIARYCKVVWCAFVGAFAVFGSAAMIQQVFPTNHAIGDFVKAYAFGLLFLFIVALLASWAWGHLDKRQAAESGTTKPGSP